VNHRKVRLGLLSLSCRIESSYFQKPSFFSYPEQNLFFFDLFSPCSSQVLFYYTQDALENGRFLYHGNLNIADLDLTCENDGYCTGTMQYPVVPTGVRKIREIINFGIVHGMESANRYRFRDYLLGFFGAVPART
jgi:hypothetical protein